MKKTLLIISIMALLICLVMSVSFAGTTVITVKTEGEGDINKNSGQQNLNGAMVWNGSEWVVNNTWSHKFFVDVRTGERLKDYSGKDVTVNGASDTATLAAWEKYQSDMNDYFNAVNTYNTDLTNYNNALNAWNADPDPNKAPFTMTPPVVPTQPTAPSAGYGNYYPPENYGNYTITKQSYSYSMPAAADATATYIYQAVEYVIHDNNTGKNVVLKSRGSGNGKDTGAYFNVYIDDEDGSGSTAMRGDPVWFNYNTTAQQSKSNQNTTQGLTGYLPGAVETKKSSIADYYLDIGGGADMGGKSFEMHCAPVSPKTWTLGGNSSFVTGFELKYMDSSGNLQKITVSPTLLNEVYIPPPPPNPPNPPNTGGCCC